MAYREARINRPRNRFNMSHTVSTTFDAGKVIPLTWYEILPGDTVDLDVSFVTRMLTPKVPVMADMFQDFQAVFVPYEIIWNQFKQFMGQNETTAWTESTTYLVPQAQASNLDYDIVTGSIGDYLGLGSVGDQITDEVKVLLGDTNALPLRGYLALWNYWWRDQNLVDPALYSKESDTTESDYSVHYYDEPLEAMKLPDYFTTCLPDTSKVQPVDLAPAVPVKTGATWLTDSEAVPSALRFGEASGLLSYSDEINNKGLALGSFASNKGNDAIANISAGGAAGPGVSPVNLWTSAGNLTIESIRRAAVYQHVGEVLARGGSRYASEFLKNIFGVENSDSLLDEPEHLGGFRRMINMTEVLSNADTSSGESEGRYLGSNGAMSKTSGSSQKLCTHTFSRHGMLFVVCCVRKKELYFQGSEKKWTRKSFWDFYLPQAQGLGFQKVYKSELWEGVGRSEIFGFQDYGAEYRYQPDRLTGYLRPNISGGLVDWTNAQIFSAAPTLGPDFIKADSSGINRTLAFEKTGFQFFGSYYFKATWTRVVGIQRYPGLDRI